MEKNCIFSWGLERWGKRESTYALSSCTEGVKIYLFLRILIAVQGFCLYNHSSSPPSAPAFHCCFSYKLLSSRCTNNIFCMHLLFTQLNAFILAPPPNHPCSLSAALSQLPRLENMAATVQRWLCFLTALQTRSRRGHLFLFLVKAVMVKLAFMPTRFVNSGVKWYSKQSHLMPNIFYSQS